jgi:hypothetical protein
MPLPSLPALLIINPSGHQALRKLDCADSRIHRKDYVYEV